MCLSTGYVGDMKQVIKERRVVVMVVSESRQSRSKVVSQRSRESVDCGKRELPLPLQLLWTGATNGRAGLRKAQSGTVERSTGATAELSKASGRGRSGGGREGER